MRKGIKNLSDLYGSQGYINFTPVPDTEVNDDRKTVRIVFNLDEGKQYRVGHLILSGVEPYPGVGSELLEAWKSIEGKIYESRGFEQFLITLNGAGFRKARLAMERAESYDISQHNDTQTLDFRINFPDPK